MSPAPASLSLPEIVRVQARVLDGSAIDGLLMEMQAGVGAMPDDGTRDAGTFTYLDARSGDRSSGAKHAEECRGPLRLGLEPNLLKLHYLFRRTHSPMLPLHWKGASLQIYTIHELAIQPQEAMKKKSKGLCLEL
ncbi:hypothetical protein VNI00_018394 [Paramarasmius palmivorus]|uniref:Transthyretin n=1 Tax=Paramarasmius palmivorus TaxID=297713 RepID=A0AAW0AXK1_9AGAR